MGQLHQLQGELEAVDRGWRFVQYQGQPEEALTRLSAALHRIRVYKLGIELSVQPLPYRVTETEMSPHNGAALEFMDNLHLADKKCVAFQTVLRRLTQASNPLIDTGRQTYGVPVLLMYSPTTLAEIGMCGINTYQIVLLQKENKMQLWPDLYGRRLGPDFHLDELLPMD